MTEQRERPRVGHRVVGTIKAVKGNCSWGHKVGDTFEVSAHDTAAVDTRMARDQVTRFTRYLTVAAGASAQPRRREGPPGNRALFLS